MDKIISIIRKGKLVAFCGAGISSESGIPTFRGKNGLWEKYDPYLFAAQDSFNNLLLTNPFSLRDFIVDIYKTILLAKPNHAHSSLAHLENAGLLAGIITQNIDNLHYEAGNKEVAEIHGNAYVFLCKECGHKTKKKKEEIEDFIYSIEKEDKKNKLTKELLSFTGICPRCNNRLESGVVFFGQELPSREIEKSYQYINRSLTMVCIGTSAEVYPAANLPYYAKEKGLKIININPTVNRLDEIADFSIHKKAVDFFKEIMAYLDANNYKNL